MRAMLKSLLFESYSNILLTGLLGVGFGGRQPRKVKLESDDRVLSIVPCMHVHV